LAQTRNLSRGRDRCQRQIERAQERAPLEELIPAEPFRTRIKLPAGTASTATARLPVRGGSVAVAIKDGVAAVEAPSVLDHEVIVIG
jgi:hypothetical protein